MYRVSSHAGGHSRDCIPPATTKVSPVTYLESSDARKATMPAHSSGVPSLGREGQEGGAGGRDRREGQEGGVGGEAEGRDRREGQGRAGGRDRREGQGRGRRKG